MRRIAYADPPYLGMAAKFYASRHRDAAAYDSIETHRQLIDSLVTGFDAFALSCASVNLRDILPLCPAGVRVGAWVKPFASFKPGVNPAYAWEPVIFSGAPNRGRSFPTTRDWCAANITLRRGFSGAKPDPFCYWVFEMLGAEPSDELTDLFPGSGAVGRAWDAWRNQRTLDLGAA